MRSGVEGHLVFFPWDTLPPGMDEPVTEVQCKKEGYVGSRPASTSLLYEGGALRRDLEMGLQCVGR